MKKDVFSVWLKEFCSLVFTQTVQAFLLAIIMSVVICMANSDSSQQYSGDTVSATSIIAIIALSSISKIELLVKKIFGVESQFGDPAMKNGIKTFGVGIAAGMAALNLAKRPLDNVKKTYQGIKDVRSSNMDIAKLRKRTSRDLDLLSKKEYEELNDAKSKATEKSSNPDPSLNDYDDPLTKGPRLTPPDSNSDSEKWRRDETKRRALRKNGSPDEFDEFEDDFKNGKGKVGRGSMSRRNGSGSKNNIGAGTIDGISSIEKAQFTGSIRSIDGGIHGDVSGNVSRIDAPNANVDSGKKDDKKQVSLLGYEEKRNSIMDKYDDALSEAKKKRKKAITQTASGIVETAGAGVGAINGATLKTIIDVAQGDASLSSTIKAGITGAGIGDMIGEKITSAVSSGLSIGKDALTGNTRGAKMEKIKNETIQNISESKHYDAASANIINNNPSVIKTETRYEQSGERTRDLGAYRSSIKYIEKSGNSNRAIREETAGMDNNPNTNAGNI